MVGNKLISDTYRALNAQLHVSDPTYGARAAVRAKSVHSVAKQTKARSILDYGCGKGGLRPALLELDPTLIVGEYDPAVSGKDYDPPAADLLVCLDVLEHIEPETLDAVLAHMRSKTLKAALMTICTRPAGKTLADGRNAHLIVQPAEWWRQALERHFYVAQIVQTETAIFTVIAGPRSLG